MPLMSFDEQIASHIAFLRQCGVAVAKLAIDAGFVRCQACDEKWNCRGEYAYQTSRNLMDKPGLVGLMTWCRGPSGYHEHKTYGLDWNCGASATAVSQPSAVQKANLQDDIVDKCQYIWDRSFTSGRSDYLDRKGVGAHGLRFLENKYGCVAVVPGRNAQGDLHTLQFLNPGGEKRFLANTSPTGLFHMLKKPKNGCLVGVSESYVTAATCMELSGIITVCSFNSDNLKNVALILRDLYPDCPLIIFADNDRHLEVKGLSNKGLTEAEQVRNALGDDVCLVIPDFGELEPKKDASDWNDLVRLCGIKEAKRQIMRIHKD